MTTHTIGAPVPRVDGRLKVTGAATYAVEFQVPEVAYAVIVSATVGRGRVTAVHAEPVARMPGVLAVLSHLNAPVLPYKVHKGPTDPAFGERLHVLQDDQVRFFGQPVAVIVAETLDEAERAALALRVEYDATRPVLDITGPVIAPQAGLQPGSRMPADRARGDADAAFAEAAIRHDATYEISRENHNPMEPHATVAAWQDGRLTLWSKSQFVVNEAAEIASVFGLPADHVDVICPFIGGAFGTSLRTWPHVTVAAMAARELGRPVKLVLTRRQMFFTTGHRPRTSQRVALAARPDGALTSIIHEGVGETSRYEEFTEALTTTSAYLYSCPNVRNRYRLAPIDIGTPTFMRGPGETSGIFALECAMDELAVQLGLDPLTLRRRNEPSIDEAQGRPFSSRSLLACYDLAAERFGWSRRSAAPGSMRDGRLLIGWGMAAATYPTFRLPATACARLMPDGSAEVESAASDMGPGTYTSMTQVAAETLDLPMNRVRFSLGDSLYVPAPPHGGSMTMASVGSAVRDAALAALRAATEAAVADPASPLAGACPDDIETGGGGLRLRADPSRAQSYAAIVAGAGGAPIEATVTSARGPEGQRVSMHAFGAVFTEVAVDPDLGTVRVRRVVGAYGAGRIVNPRLAASQCIGGMVGGIGMALMERTVLDPRDGRVVNASMADYLVPVNLDIGSLEAHFVPEEDTDVNPLGVKGLGELALIGVAPAIANAVHHATGRRLRKLPIRLEHLVST